MPRKLVESARQRRGQALDFPHQLPNPANFGAYAGGHHHPLPLTIGHDGAGKTHAIPIANPGFWSHGGQLFFHRGRFASQHRFHHPQVFGLDEAHIGGHFVARFEQHHVTGHQFAGIDVLALTIAPHIGACGQHTAYRVQCAFGLAFLNVANDGVDEHHTHDHARIHVAAQRQRGQPSGQQHVNQRVVELQQKAQPHGTAGGFGQTVGAVLGQALLHLLGA